MDSSFFRSNISNSNMRRFSHSLVRDSCRIEFSVSNIRCFRIVCLLEALVNLLFTHRDRELENSEKKGRDFRGRFRDGSVEPPKLDENCLNQAVLTRTIVSKCFKSSPEMLLASTIQH